MNGNRDSNITLYKYLIRKKFENKIKKRKTKTNRKREKKRKHKS